MATKPIAAANQSLYESCTTDFIKLDADGRIVLFSEQLCTLMGFSHGQIIGQYIEQFSPQLHALLSNDQFELKSTHGDCHRFSHTSLLDDSDHSCLHIFTNISTIYDLYNENQRLKEEAHQLQLIDPDTSLLTHRALLLVLESQVSRSRRYQTPLSVLILKLDESTGSSEHKLKMLKLSRLLKDQLRWSDMIARSTINSFTIVLPETDHSAAHNLVDKLQAALSRNINIISVQSGIATWDRHTSAIELLEHCQQQLSKMPGDSTHCAVC